MPYQVTQGSGLWIASDTYVEGANTVHVPIISNKVISISSANTGVTATAYSANQLIGTSQFTFSNVALKAGMGGVIQNASLYCDVVSTGQYLIRLFDKPITTAFTDKLAYSSYALTDVEAQSFIADIEFSFGLASSLNTLYSITGVGAAFTTDSSGSPSIYGLLLSRNANTMTGVSTSGIRVTLEILQ